MQKVVKDIGSHLGAVSKVADNIGAFFGALSIVLLARQAFRFGLIAPLEQALHYYNASVNLVFGWSEPYLSAVLRRISWNLDLHSHWKHVLVVMWLYFGVVAKVLWSAFNSVRTRVLLLLLTSWGIVVALGASVAAGALDLRDARSNGLMAVFPIIGFVLYQLALAGWLAAIGSQESWWSRYRAAARLYVGPRVIVPVVLALVFAILTDRIPFLAPVPNLGLLLLFVLIIALAFYWLWTGIEGAVAHHRPPKGSWWRTFRSTNWWKSWRVMSNSRIGLSILKSIAGAALFILLGAGLA